ncbi:glycosyltransferase family 9 protein [Aquirufa rosea]|uniref:Glycosyltransferase family 9 protein n=1 Tax=Aquirufa rosea TaxID=2509241 RepID=A0A4Q1BY01_9BACT|nr:glycosyltransferase family 9 protein [Aquirufa rosea]RXK47596.1 glycosyltransferase family 9 protein [Aquirufa rosea]
MNKILCIRFSSLGDIVLTTPIIRTLKTRYPNAQIHVATKQSYANLWQGNPYVHQVHCYQDNLWKLASELRNEGFDAVIDLHKNIRSHLLCFLLGKIPYQIDKFTRERKLLVKKKINYLPKKHLVDRYFDSLKKLDIRSDGQGLDFFIPKGQELNPKEWGIEGKYIVYAIGAQYTTKVLSYPKMIELCDRIQGKLVLIGDAWDEHFAYRLQTLFPEKVINMCNRTSVAGSASLMKQAEFVIAHDSSMMHIAAALKKKLFVLWGATHSDFGFYPYQTEYTSVEMSSLDCRPCSTQGTNYCPLGHFDCLNKVSLEPIISASQHI